MSAVLAGGLFLDLLKAYQGLAARGPPSLTMKIRIGSCMVKDIQTLHREAVLFLDARASL